MNTDLLIAVSIIVAPLLAMPLPEPGEASAAQAGGNGSGISVTESKANMWVVDNGALRFGLSTGRHATLRWVQVGEKQVVDGNEAALLTATLMASDTYDGTRDHVSDRTFLESTYAVESADVSVEDDRFEARLSGALTFTDGDAFDFVLHLGTVAEQAHLSIDVELEPRGAFRDRYVREVALQVPMSLNWRKRVAQGGDQGLEWDTRYYYEFPHTGGRLMMAPAAQPHPDRNEFRQFAVEQDSPHHFRIWRAESAHTPELTHQHGVEAAGWTSVYDQAGGALFAYRNMAAHAPKTLWVNAQGSGEAQVLLHPATSAAFALTDERMSTRVFGMRHRTDWLFYTGEHPEASPDDRLAALWDKSAPLSGERPREGLASLWDADLELWDAPMLADERSPYVSGGVPLPRGQMEAKEHAVVMSETGGHPTQARPLAWWPDGTVKWLHVVFPLDPAPANLHNVDVGTSSGKTGFDVTMRDGSKASFTLHYGARLRPVHGETRVQTAKRGGRVRVDTGPLRMDLATGERWIEQAWLNGEPLLGEGAETPLAMVDFLRVDEPYVARTRHPQGELDAGAVTVDRLEVEESGPLRAVLRLEGTARSAEPTTIILRLHFYAGQAGVRLFHTAEFTQSDPRKRFPMRMGLNLPLRLESARVTAGGEAGPVSVPTGHYAALRQSSHMHYRLLSGSGNNGWPELVEEKRRSRGWMDVSDAQRGVTVAIRNMWQSHPKAITYRPQTGELTAWLWPESARLMDVRRYSNYPHAVQGESIGGSGNEWVEEAYYSTERPFGDPFVGTARSHELMLLFHEGPEEPGALDSRVADFQSPPLVYSGLARYRQAGITVPLPDYEQFPRISENMSRFTDFWLFHQRYWGWYGFWNFGDVQHRFRGSGYGWMADADRLAEVWAMPEDERPSRLDSDEITRDYHPQQDWLFDNGRWGWTNTEGLPGLYFQMEYLRTGRRDVFFAAEALGRHARDVVTRHSGLQFGKGTRHGVQHWSDGNHEERQTVFSEYRFHYYLTGERRSRDVMGKLADYYSTGTARRADHNARIYGLLTHWEMTGDPEVGQLVRDYLHAMIVPEGFAGYANIQIREDGVTASDIEGGLHTRRMFFHNFGAMHGVLEYFQVTEDPALREALVRTAQATFDEDDGFQHGSASLGMLAAFGAMHAEDPRMFQDIVIGDLTTTSTGSRDAFMMVARNPMHWTGETAWLSKQSPLCWFYMNSLPMVLTAAGGEPELVPRLWDRFDQMNERPRPERSRLPYEPRPSWQAEYDAETLESYFGPWRPAESQSPRRGP